jgi:hypothetical protein
MFMTEDSFNQIIYLWIGLAVIVFLVNLKIVAPYGRHTSARWGIRVNARMAWVIMEVPVLFLVTYLMLTGSKKPEVITGILYFVFAIHYVHRTFIYPFRIKNGKKSMPLLILLMAITFNCVNGFFIGFYLGNYASYGDDWITNVYFVTGLVLFLSGMYINWRSDGMLIRLRRPGGARYSIPHGFLFEKVSCPNHFGEIMEWGGYALMSFNLPALSFAVWSAANLIPRSLAHHRWYKLNFPDYPPARKAVIPGVL